MRRVALLLVVLCLGFAPAPAYRAKPGRERTLLIQLDPVQWAAHGLKPADVEIALTPSGIAVGARHAMKFIWHGKYLLEVIGTPAQPLPGSPKQLGNIILRATAEGDVLRLMDVARLRSR